MFNCVWKRQETVFSTTLRRHDTAFSLEPWRSMRHPRLRRRCLDWLRDVEPMAAAAEPAAQQPDAVKELFALMQARSFRPRPSGIGVLRHFVAHASSLA